LLSTELREEANDGVKRAVLQSKREEGCTGNDQVANLKDHSQFEPKARTSTGKQRNVKGDIRPEVARSQASKRKKEPRVCVHLVSIRVQRTIRGKIAGTQVEGKKEGGGKG